jgi:Homing endonuclease associated repeat
VARVLAGETLQRVADDHSLTRQRVSQIVHAAAPSWDGDERRSKRAAEAHASVGPCVGRPRAWSNTEVLDALRGAAVDGRAPSQRWWSGFCDGPSASVVVNRFGSWNAACAAAGLRTTLPTVARRASRMDMLAAVTNYLSDGGAGVRGYTVWARLRGAPSAGSLRKEFGSWSAAKAAATEYGG